MKRRFLVRNVGVGTLAILAGCITTSPEDDATTSPSPEDFDGDGVPNEHDYAPRDSEVQSKSDVLTATRTPIPTPTQYSIQTSTPTRSSAASTIQANSGPLEGYTHHLTEYSLSHVNIRLYGDGLDNSYQRGADPVVVIEEYPDPNGRGDILDYQRGETFEPPDRGPVTVTVEFEKRTNIGTSFYYWTFLAPPGKDISELDEDEGEHLCESDRLSSNGGDLIRNPHPSAKGDEETNGYTRYDAEGCYALSFSGHSYSQSWQASFVAYKHGYIQDVYDQRYSDRRQYVYEAVNEGLADEFGRILDEEAEDNGITGTREKVEFLIDFVQNLPYVPDDVSTGFDDYTKRHIETLVDGGGDCEDSAIMLASLLLSNSFGYGTALIQPPNHMAVGVKGGDNLDGYYWEKDGTKYYYIETTGEGWGVGEIPEEYQNENAYVYVL